MRSKLRKSTDDSDWLFSSFSASLASRKKAQYFLISFITFFRSFTLIEKSEFRYLSSEKRMLFSCFKSFSIRLMSLNLMKYISPLEDSNSITMSPFSLRRNIISLAYQHWLLAKHGLPDHIVDEPCMLGIEDLCFQLFNFFLAN